MRQYKKCLLTINPQFMEQSEISLADRLIAISTTASFYDALATNLVNGYWGRNYLNAYAAGLYELTGKQKWKDFPFSVFDEDKLLEDIWLEGEELADQTEELTRSLKMKTLSQTEFVLWFNAFVDVIDFKREKGNFIRLASEVIVCNRFAVSEEICSAFAGILSGMHMQAELLAFMEQMGFHIFPVMITLGEA